MVVRSKNAVSCIIIISIILSLISAALGSVDNQSALVWDFQNKSYFNFDSAETFSGSPGLGLNPDHNLICYWNLNEASGETTHDSTGNSINGTIIGAQWVNGKYDQALNFNGTTDYVLSNYSSALNFGQGSFSFGCWVTFEPQPSGDHIILRGDNELSAQRSLFSLAWVSSGVLKLSCYDSKLTVNNSRAIQESVNVDNELHFIMGVRDGDNLYLYVDKELIASTTGVYNFNISSTDRIVIGRYERTNGAFLKGIVDDVRIYNTSLSQEDISSIYTAGPIPDSKAYSDYYNFVDSVTNDAMLLHIVCPMSIDNNATLVTCNNFFVNNKLLFHANNSATVNIWTNLGRPIFTTGVWNSQNYTTTLTLELHSTGELDWNPSSSLPLQTSSLSSTYCR